MSRQIEPDDVYDYPEDVELTDEEREELSLWDTFDPAYHAYQEQLRAVLAGEIEACGTLRAA